MATAGSTVRPAGVAPIGAGRCSASWPISTIRKRTGNKKGLQQALRGIVAAGGTIEQDWPVARIFSVGDKATGTTVLADLYKKMRDKPYAPDLDALWRDLGVSVQGGGVTFDDNAPLAPIRRAITAAPAG